MYSRYRRINENGSIRLLWDEQVALAGCNKGVIAAELREIIQPSHSAPMGWSTPIAEKWNPEAYSLIIDIKPNADEIFLCELDRVFGYSYEGWTPIMLRLKILYQIWETVSLDKHNFVFPTETKIVYTMYYLYGTIKEGKLHGTWNPPFGKITALLFWPEALTYFTSQVQKYDPNFLKADIKLMTV